MPSLDRIRSALAARSADLVEDPDRPRAAVAVVLRPGDQGLPELLLIERAQRAGDPWSGHMAFPGGRLEPEDADSQAAAERETLEEVGLCLAGAEHLGRLDDLEGRAGGRKLALVISAYVYFAEAPGPLEPNHEVAETLWVPLEYLSDPARHVEYPHVPGQYPGIEVGDPERHIIWGLTYRFLEVFLGRLGVTFPNRWEPARSPDRL